MHLWAPLSVLWCMTFLEVQGQTDLLDALGIHTRPRKAGLRSAIVPYSNRHDFWTWPNKVVPYYFDASFTPAEKAKMQQAMAAVVQNLTGCIRFEEVAPNAPKFKLKITPFETDNVTAAKFCKSWPGIYKPFLATKKWGEQRFTVARGADGCLDAPYYDQHDLMKMFTIILGRRNEHQRHDRDNYITMNMTNLQPGAELAYRLHPVEAFVYVCNYDYCSITHNQPNYFAKPGTSMFTVPNLPKFIPKLGKLSGCDCKEITELYKCSSEKCDFSNSCEAQVPPAPQPASRR